MSICIFVIGSAMPKHKSIGGRKSVRIRKVAPKKAKAIYNSDDDIPDETSESFFKDDIDTYNDGCKFTLKCNHHIVFKS